MTVNSGAADVQRPPSVPARLHALGARLAAALASPRWAPAWTLAGIYLVQYLLIRSHLKLGFEVQLARPFTVIPGYLFLGWDGSHYFRLAQSFDSYAWPPLYPLLLRWLSAAFAERALEKAAVLVNLGAHLAIAHGAAALLRAHPRLERIPSWVFTALLLFFPGHNVFFAAYSESLFLALTLWSCAFWLRGRSGWAGLLAGLACLTRLFGAYFGAALLAAELWRVVRSRSLKAEWRRVALLGSWVLVLAGWALYVRQVGGTTLGLAQLPWQQELLDEHVPAGANAQLWVLRYVAFSGQKEVLFFWAVVVAMVVLAARRFTALALYLGFFLLSFGLHLYRPFPFTRFVSVLFPLPLLAADLLRRWPRLQPLAVGLCAIQASLAQLLLFSDRWGEP